MTDGRRAAEQVRERPARTRPGKLGTIIVTGSGGFLGTAIIARLAGRFDVVGLDFKVPPRAAPELETIRTDLSDPGSVNAAIDRIRVSRGPRIVAVIHLAAYYDLSGDPNPMYDKVTVEGTRNLVRALRGMQVDQFVFASTILVHAPTEPGRPIDEDWPIDPATPYPQSKVEAEDVLRAERGEMPVVILRCAGVYSDDGGAAFLAQQIANIFEQRMISRLYPGKLESGQPYLHIDDLVTAIAQAVERRAELPPATTLLIGEPETMSYGDLQARIGELIHGEPWDTREIPSEFAELGQWLQEDVLDLDPFIQPWMIDQASYHLELDIARAKKLLGWTPKHALRETLPTMIAGLKEDPAGWYRRNKLNPAMVAAARIDRSEPGKPGDARRAERKMREADARSRWAGLANAGLGLWLIGSPFVFGLFDAAALGDRLTGWNELACGALLAVLAVLALDQRRRWLDWVIALLGTWLMTAPLVFWTTSAAAYATDSAAGALAVLFAVVLRPPPGIAPDAIAATSDMPAGWTYSPSLYSQRLPIVALALIGFLVSRYLAAFQLGHIDAVWDPFFGQGTERIITSSVSEAWPIPDAGVGAVTYLIEALTGLVGDRRRWRTMPWLVLAFGLMIVPLGGVSIFFIMIQPVLLGDWCTICLATAAISVIMIPYSLDELLATAQFLLRSRRAGLPFWRTFWRGGALPGEPRDKSPDIDAPPGRVLHEFLIGGVTFPWPLVTCIAIGALLMLTRLLTGAEGALANSDHLVGCFVITFSATALAGMARAVRFANLPLGAWLVASPFLLAGGTPAAIGFDIVAGVLLIALSLPRGDLGGEHYGGWDRAVV